MRITFSPVKRISNVLFSKDGCCDVQLNIESIECPLNSRRCLLLLNLSTRAGRRIPPSQVLSACSYREAWPTPRTFTSVNKLQEETVQNIRSNGTRIAEAGASRRSTHETPPSRVKTWVWRGRPGRVVWHPSTPLPPLWGHGRAGRAGAMPSCGGPGSSRSR
jgi:hypothetical protein